MAKLSFETKEQIRQATHHPVVWWKGTGSEADQLKPWESGIQFLAEALKGFMGGFTGNKDRLYLGMGEGKVPPNLKTVVDVVTMTWDALNDPPIGVYMDRKRFSEKVHRWIMRYNATFSPLFILIQCFDFGLTPVQRVIEWIVISMFADLMSTANAVSESKIWAGITPHTEQRSTLQLWRTLGGHVSGVFSGIPNIFMGLKSVLGITDYQILIWGAIIFAPLTIFSRWLPSFAKQRVDFTVKVNAENEAVTEEVLEERMSLRESFTIVKHNRWFIMWAIVNLIRVILPKTDEMNLYRFLLPKMNVRGKELGGEILYTVKGIITGLPAFLLSPLAVKAVDKFGGNVNFIRAHIITIMITRTATYFVGYQSTARIAFMFAMEMVRMVMDMWSPIPHGIINYQMFDYVEWKTGYRSEGITQSVDGMLNKLLKNNLSSVFGNAVTQWTGYKGWDIPKEEQPERFLNTIWPLMHLGVLAGEVVVLVAMLLFKMPHDPALVEADLIERRALLKKMKEEEAAAREEETLKP